MSRTVNEKRPEELRSLPSSGESTQIKIARAMSAGPAGVAKAARIVDTDAQGKMVVLREGNNGFTCMPGNLEVCWRAAHVRGCRVDAVVRRRQSSQTETD
jgi:hypothetical protein